MDIDESRITEDTQADAPSQTMTFWEAANTDQGSYGKAFKMGLSIFVIMAMAVGLINNFLWMTGGTGFFDSGFSWGMNGVCFVLLLIARALPDK